MADIPVPSIESNLDSRLRSPSVSITPPSSSAFSTPESSTRNTQSDGRLVGLPLQQHRFETNGITSDLENMRLTSQIGVTNMSDLASAVAGVERGSDSRQVSLSPEATRSSPGLTTPRQRRRSRRSSAQGDRGPHVVSEEELPEDAFHSPAFQQAFRDAKQLMTSMESVLRSSSLHTEPDSNIGRLHTEVAKLASFQYPATRTVGFVGESGVGKSSVLNSLLDSKGLARTSNSGEACTCVPTEYHFHTNDGFSIEVNLFSEEDLHSQITELLQPYRQFHLHGGEMESADRSAAEEKANLARDTFHAMFRGQLRGDSFLVNQPEEDVLRALFRWTTNSRPSNISSRQSGLSLEDCSTALMELSSEPASRDRPAVWPYIRHIKVFLNAHILSRGLVLVDLPGLRDLNSARKIITERYLLECNEIFAICNSGRAVTDEGVREVFQLARRARLSNVGIICTRSDDIEAEEALRDWRQDRRRDRVQELMQAIAADKEERKEIQAGLQEFDLDEDLSLEEKDDQRSLCLDLERVRQQEKSHEYELQEYLTNTRNRHVRQELTAAYNNRASNNGVGVFCVSNKLYWDHREEPRSLSQRWLTLSGIIEVRGYCISMVANSQRQAASRYMKDEIPALLAQIELWVQSGARTASEERREALCRALDEAETQLRRELDSRTSLINGVADSFRQEFATNIYGRRATSSWSRSARDAGDHWSTWHHSTYSAFCRNYGDYATPAVGAHNWNEEAMSGLVEDLEDHWEDLLLRFQQYQEELVQFVETTTNAAIESFESHLDEHQNTSIPLTQTLGIRQRLLVYAIESVYEQFETNLGRVRIDVFSGIRSSLFGKAIESAYRDCNLEYGRGSDARRKAIINGKLGNEELFRALMKDFRDMFRDRTNGLQDGFQAATASFLEIVQTTFDLVRSESVARESERDPDFRLRVEEAANSGRREIQRIQSIVGI